MGFLQFCNTTNTDAVPSLDMNALQQQQLQEFELYVIRLRNGEWADNLAVQGIKIMRSWPILLNIPMGMVAYRQKDKITARRYFNQRLLQKDGRFA